jgi:hypothetical protein
MASKIGNVFWEMSLTQPKENVLVMSGKQELLSKVQMRFELDGIVRAVPIGIGALGLFPIDCTVSWKASPEEQKVRARTLVIQ